MTDENIYWLEVPVTRKELDDLLREAVFLQTGAAWEALRARANMPSRPYRFAKWLKEKRKARRYPERVLRNGPIMELFENVNNILDEDNDDPIGMVDWWTSPNRFIDPHRKPTPLSALLDGTLTIEQVEAQAAVDSRGMW